MQLENVKNTVGTTEKIKTEESEDNKMKNLKTLQTLSKMGKILSRIAFVFAMIGACGCIIGLLSVTFGNGSAIKIGGVTLHSMLAISDNYNLKSVSAVLVHG